MPIREKCPNTEFFLIRTFSPNTEKYGPVKFYIWSLFEKWSLLTLSEISINICIEKKSLVPKRKICFLADLMQLAITAS